ncbi:MAG TPA: hypothetical protein VLS89_15890 [Candidatus Nanopelagicales bacterium]|nr:hypothetical protein [Candidatus Nanopelagicales bacterium]
MLAKTRFSLLVLPVVASMTLFAGCVVEQVDTDNPVNTSSNGTGTTTTTGQGGSGGEGGAGGSGGAGGGTACVDDVATDPQLAVAACDELNIAPAQGATQCVNEPMSEPFGYRLCQWGFTNLNEGAAEYMHGCLAQIGVQDACESGDESPPQVCFNELYAESCTIERVGELCDALGTGCDPNGVDPEVINQAGCRAALNPFSDAAFSTLADCINAQPVDATCQDAYDTCVIELTTF